MTRRRAQQAPSYSRHPHRSRDKDLGFEVEQAPGYSRISTCRDRRLGHDRGLGLGCFRALRALTQLRFGLVQAQDEVMNLQASLVVWPGSNCNTPATTPARCLDLDELNHEA